MQLPESVVTRIEYRTKMTRGDAPTIPLGYLVEACWDDAKWVGLIGRVALTPTELQHVNLETWPELGDVNGFLTNVFKRACATDCERGSDALYAEFGTMGALTFVHCEEHASFAADIVAPLEATCQQILSDRLERFADDLRPAFTQRPHFGFADWLQWGKKRVPSHRLVAAAPRHEPVPFGPMPVLAVLVAA